METVTTAGAGAAVTSPLWITQLNPYAQFIFVVLGSVWIGVQIYYRIKNERKKHK